MEETMDNFLDLAGIPLLLFVILVYYAIRLWLTGDSTIIRGKDKGPLKDEKMYVKQAAGLMLFLAVATLVMTALLFWNVKVAIAEIVICILVLGIMWKRMNEKYGGRG
ncbi:hypothetical protein D3Z36_11290 [Lachnospiraceae bacterium]|nr:hypothetical protein [Lachnospiraceae bacterium]